MNTLVEVGPATVRAWCVDAGLVRPAEVVIDPTLAHAWADGGDGRRVLVGQDVRALSEVAAAVLALLAGPQFGVVALVHPGWWSGYRLTVLRDAAAGLVVRSRTEVLLDAHPGALVIELADRLIILSSKGIRRGHPRFDPVGEVLEWVLAAVAEYPDAAVVLDADPDVSGASALAEQLVDRLAAAGRRVRRVGVRDFLAAVPSTSAPSIDDQPSPRRPVLRISAALGVAALGVTAGVVLWPSDPPATVEHVLLVEGGVSVQVPADWAVRRVTDDAGSPRLEISAPTEPQAVVHLTQSWTPATDLGSTADLLGRLMDDQNVSSPGVFTDFEPSTTVLGRPAVTYREVRPARTVQWTVVLDKSVRISIGCQHPDGRPAAVTVACELAIGSARAVR